jgi:hypothetical protein
MLQSFNQLNPCLKISPQNTETQGNMLSSSIATLYFDSYRTYCTVLEQHDDVYALTYLNATNEPFDFTRPLEDVLVSDAMHQTASILAPIVGTVRSCAVATTMESVIAYQIPYSNTLTTDELRRLVRLEATEHLPSYDPSQFLATIYPLYGFAANPFMAMSVLVSKTVTSVAEQAAQILNADLQRLIVTQTAAHTAFRHNYPEERGVTALVGFQRGYLDVSIIRNSVLLHTMTVSLEKELTNTLHEAAELGFEQEKNALEKTGLGELCYDALSEAAEAVKARIEGAYFFGADLSKTALDELQASPTIRADGISIQRLNPLRRLSTTLDGRLREYCSRVAHILAPSIGAALPEVQSGIILSSNIPTSHRLEIPPNPSPFERKTA